MVEIKDQGGKKEGRDWQTYCLLSFVKLWELLEQQKKVFVRLGVCVTCVCVLHECVRSCGWVRAWEKEGERLLVKEID